MTSTDQSSEVLIGMDFLRQFNLAQTIDIYDAATGEYQHSIKLPENGFTHALNDRVYQVGDSTVSVWAIEKSSLRPELSASPE